MAPTESQNDTIHNAAVGISAESLRILHSPPDRKPKMINECFEELSSVVGIRLKHGDGRFNAVDQANLWASWQEMVHGSTFKPEDIPLLRTIYLRWLGKSSISLSQDAEQALQRVNKDLRGGKQQSFEA
ncbi:hypothetical protein EJ05DRAFT_506094 [Pseudovirgaria hyperparasitica]|uniref:Uncharacterized protein n=1 Tax=Pseudovirgaria hyperparasitica TaxID=470096 RepID=A0A6A6VSY1_9PEZI|nr:uncharacterized protein EJ05DRAFT_506094 [Pseudovirgaria hyperparasitica]KAF2752381.1 hypothetical protein EJ05DRAFT_506094 [Pseudovirgaria hyperparasitica]